jgi:hypothetical protein
MGCFASASDPKRSFAFRGRSAELDFDFLIDGNHLGWMADAFPAHVGDVQQTIDTTQVDERTEVGDVLDHTLADLTNFQFAHQVIRDLLRVASRSTIGG